MMDYAQTTEAKAETETPTPPVLTPYLQSIRLLGARLLVEIEPDEFVTDAGLVIDNHTIERPRRLVGRVLRVGPGRRLDNGDRVPLGWRPGERIVVPRSMAWAVIQDERTNGREVLILSEDQPEKCAIEGEGRVTADIAGSSKGTTSRTPEIQLSRG